MSNCDCRKHKVRSIGICLRKDCQYQCCKKHSYGDFCVCICHIKKVDTLSKLKEKIEKRDGKGYFYIGSSEITDEDKLFKYVAKPVECKRYRNAKNQCVLIRTIRLHECFYWKKSQNMKFSENELLKFAYIPNYSKFKTGLNDYTSSGQDRKPGSIYVRFYEYRSVIIEPIKG